MNMVVHGLIKPPAVKKTILHCIVVGAITVCLIALVIVGVDLQAKSGQNKRLMPLTTNLVRKIDRFVLQHFSKAAQELAANLYLVNVCCHLEQADNPNLFNILETASSVLDAAIVYVMDTDGLVVGSSIFGDQKSLTGNNYGFRPYFIEAMKGKVYQFPAVGVTTQEKGIYFSAPVNDPKNGQVVGVVVIKTKGDTVDQFFHDFQGPLDAMLLSPDGVVFSATRDEWFFATALPITEQQRAELRQSRQFSSHELKPLDFTLDDDIVHYENRRAIVQKHPIALKDWQVVTLISAPFPIEAAAALSIIVIMFAFFWINGVFHRRTESRLLRELKRFKYRRDRAVEARRQTLLELESIFSTSHIGIVLLRSRRIVTINQRMLEILGYSRHEVTRAGLEVFFNGKESYRQFIAEVVPVLSHSAVEQMECMLKRKDGTLIRCMVSGKAIDKSDLAKGTVWVVEDIQKRYDIERELENALERANSANIAKSTFLANMSHEIRTPLNGIIGLSNLLLQHDITTPEKEYVRLIHEAGMRLLSLITDVLDYSKLEAGRYDVDTTPFFLQKLLNDVLQPFRFIAGKRRVLLNCDIDAKVPDKIEADQTKLTQIINNLVDNAIKFTRQGEVRVRVRLISPLQSDGGELLFEVLDTGIGIPMQYKEKVFKSFSQVDASLSREVGGSGLGLSITKRLVQIMGGKIWFESEDGYGTQFYFTLPFKCARIAETLKVPEIKELEYRAVAQILSGQHKVLVAEDEYINTVLVKTLLEQAGYHVDVVKDGREAIEAWENNDYTCILMDIQMPVMDGYEAVRSIRLKEESGNRVPIIAMTAHALTGDREKCIEAGMDEYVAKPIDGAAVLRLLRRYTHVH